MNILFFLCFISGIIEILSMPSAEDGEHSSEHGGFGYDESDPLGPVHWPEKYKKCAGKYQSPIDIEESLVTRVALPPLSMKGFEIPISSSSITNNGHTVMVQVNPSSPITLSGGPMATPCYQLAQFHFHWGANDSMGSEDLINNRSYPMELHMVFYNTDYNDPVHAQQFMDGLAVLAFFYEVSEQDNSAYNAIVEALPKIEKPVTTVPIEKSFNLKQLVSKNLDNYFTYMGSLTTPPCSEGVRWIDFKHPIYLSHAQTFRTMHSTAGILSHNARPVQPLSNRPVWYNSGSPTNLPYLEHSDSSSFKIQTNIALFLSCTLPLLYL